jgi:hypothetical protein
MSPHFATTMPPAQAGMQRGPRYGGPTAGYPRMPQLGEDLDIRIALPPSKGDGPGRSSFDGRFARAQG